MAEDKDLHERWFLLPWRRQAVNVAHSSSFSGSAYELPKWRMRLIVVMVKRAELHLGEERSPTQKTFSVEKWGLFWHPQLLIESFFCQRSNQGQIPFWQSCSKRKKNLEAAAVGSAQLMIVWCLGVKEDLVCKSNIGGERRWRGRLCLRLTPWCQSLLQHLSEQRCSTDCRPGEARTLRLNHKRQLLPHTS